MMMRQMKVALWTMCAVVAALLVGCDDSGVTANVVDTQAPDVAAVDVAEDTSTPDTNEPDTAVSDVEPDVGQPSTCDPGEGCFGESCEGNDDCLSGICALHMGEKICSKTCDETCPQGWECGLVGGGGDGQYVCISKFSHLCLPCETAEGCAGDTPNACVKYGDGTSFCGGSCDLDTPCPSGYACQEIETANGAMSYQCVNTAGVCPCTNLAIDSALSSPCETTNDLGTCSGVRICEETGLSACTALEATGEICNGIDDDCNGVADDGTCDDGNGCTIDTCAGADGCTYELLMEGECLDGDACTIGDHCEEGVCVGKDIDCDDENPCTVDSCDGLGGCKSEPQVAVCDDGDPCTLGDLCTDGTCQGTASLTCDDGNPCTDDSCGEAGCVYTVNESGCDDGNACTEGDGCADGSCVGAAVACDDGNLCTTDSCDVSKGCVTANNTQPCDDGDTCTLGDACADGGCAAGANELTCEDGNPCTDDGCDTNLGCIFTANGGACDDKNDCTTADACVEGACIGSGSLACDDGNPCTVDSCLPGGGCSYENAVGICNDGDACTINDTCQEGQCVSGTQLSCDDGNLCTDEVCEGGDCVFTANASECDDGNACTTTDGCVQGNCGGIGSLPCDDGNACTTDSCLPNEGCVSSASAGPCSDGDACTANDSCQDGQCVSGASIGCDDGNPCTDDACSGGDCTFTANAEPCDDGNACTPSSQCQDGGCMSSDVLACNDDNPCTDDGCDPQTGCTATANSAACSDGDPCFFNDECADGSCQAGPDALSCVDGDACTEDSCEPGEGCAFVAMAPCCGNEVVEDGEGCDDGNDNDNDDCTNACTVGGVSPAVSLVGDPDVSTVFNSIERTFFYSNNLTSGIWHGPSGQILTGHYQSQGYYQHGESESNYANSPNNGSGYYGRMVHMPSTGTVVWTDAPNSNGMGAAAHSQLRIGTIDPNTGALSNGSGVQFSDDYTGTCNVLSSSATDLFIVQDTNTVRRYATSHQSNTLSFIETITLVPALPVGATCFGGSCYGGSFAWDGKYLYFASSQTGQNQKNYRVYTEQGVFINEYQISGDGGINGLYFDWSVGRYAGHDGYGNRQGGNLYKCNGCSNSDDSQFYSPPSPHHN
jgi:hypothetical protein